MMKVNSNNIKDIANQITCDSLIWHDEVDSVTMKLCGLVGDANRFGCAIPALVPDCWGGQVAVLAVPDAQNRRHEWHF